MASSTRARVLSSTLAWPFDTRETVCDETPASRATSAIDGRGAAVRRLLISAMAPHFFKSALARHVSRELCSRKHLDVYANISRQTGRHRSTETAAAVQHCRDALPQSDARDLIDRTKMSANSLSTATPQIAPRPHRRRLPARRERWVGWGFVG